MDTAKAEIEIAIPLKAVYYFTSNLENLPYWGGVAEIRLVKKTPRYVGSTYVGVNKTFLRKTEIPLEIIAFAPPKVFTFRDQTNDSDFIHTFTQTVTEGREETKVVLENRVSGFSFALSKRKLASFLTNLKNQLEASEG